MLLMQVPSQVWVGSAQALKKEVIKYLQLKFCAASKVMSRACQACAACQAISCKQFYNVVWLMPNNQYKVEQIREVLARLALRLAQDEQCYFIFEDAQCLNDSAASILLKSIEEPPAGYNFIFLVPRKELLLTTILSRSIVKFFSNQDSLLEHELYQAFTFKKMNPIDFNTLLEQYKDLADQESVILLDQIYSYWLSEAQKNSSQEKLVLINQIIMILQVAQNYPPMPGSSKIFWRNLYMQFFSYY